MVQKIYAQGITFPGGQQMVGPIPGGPNSDLFTIGGIVGKAIPYVFLFAGVAFLLMIIISGFQLMTGATDPKQLDMGKKRLTYAVAGFFVIFISYWVVQGVGIMFGIPEFTQLFPLTGGR